MADIEERLKSHSSAFEGLLSLIPGNKYFEGDNSSQWNKRKQSKEDRKLAKKAKLDPDNTTTAAEYRQKRQRDEEKGEAEDGSDGFEDVSEEEVVKPKKQKKEKKAKTPKTPKKAATTNGDAAADNTPNTKTPPQKKGKGKSSSTPVAVEPEESSLPTATNDNENVNQNSDDDMADAEPIAVTGFSDLAPASPTSSTTSLPTTPASKPAKEIVDPVARAAQRARLAARIEALRASRKADNIDGSQARTRQELMEARRLKDAQRKARKQAARLAEKQVDVSAENADSADEQEESATPSAPAATKNFSFGRVMFDDGGVLDASLTTLQKEKRRKGPSDILGQLKHTEAKKRRIENMPEEKKETILEKEKWMRALKLASGEKVKDDEKLLKKALKRQEIGKRKSEKEWTERIAGQAKTKSMRIKKREENIQARKDLKANKGKKVKGAPKKGGKGKPPGKKGKKASRAGFEGSMKTSGPGIPNGKGKR